MLHFSLLTNVCLCDSYFTLKINIIFLHKRMQLKFVQNNVSNIAYTTPGFMENDKVY